ncbi:MAG: hypothetical protein HC927_03045 [Deltaproteobacteria bacterium]|nr:hypothetical protein [Deltaproteobacteria bacterium]
MTSISLRYSFLFPIALTLVACGTQSVDDEGDEQLPDGCDFHFVAGDDDRDAIQTALSEAENGSTLCFEGTFEITTDRLSTSDKAGLILRGIGEGEGVGAGAVFDFKDQVGPTGMKFANMQGITLENLTVANAAGDGIEVRGSTEVVFRNVKVTWDRGPSTDNGAYAFYPVESTNILLEGCEASNAADAGVYVGQSDNIILRDNVVFSNVSGLQVENSVAVEVYDNVAYDNTVGIFVHDLPAVPKGNGGVVWIHDNEAYANNRVNFAPSGIIAKVIPPGLGMLVMSIDEVEVSANDLRDNDSAGLAIVSFLTVELLDPPEREPDPEYDPYPEHYWVHDNTFANNGMMPDVLFSVFGFSESLADIMWDGIFDMSKDNADGWLNICMANNGAATYANIDTQSLHGGANMDMSVHDCVHDPIGPVDNGL